MKAGEGHADRPDEEESDHDQRLAALRKRFVEGLDAWMTPTQVQVRRAASGDFVVDLRSVPVENMKEIVHPRRSPSDSRL